MYAPFNLVTYLFLCDNARPSRLSGGGFSAHELASVQSPRKSEAKCHLETQAFGLEKVNEITLAMSELVLLHSRRVTKTSEKVCNDEPIPETGRNRDHGSWDERYLPGSHAAPRC